MSDGTKQNSNPAFRKVRLVPAGAWCSNCRHHKTQHRRLMAQDLCLAPINGSLTCQCRCFKPARKPRRPVR